MTEGDKNVFQEILPALTPCYPQSYTEVF